MADSTHRWWLALGGAALLVTATLGGLVVLRKRQAQGAPGNEATPAAASAQAGAPAEKADPAAPDPSESCGPQRSEFHPLPDAESPPVILWAAGASRLFIDDQAAFSPPEAPRRFPPGEHVIRIEAKGAEGIQTRVRFDAFRPVLLHAQLDPSIGLSLVRLGAACVDCEPGAKGFDLSPARPPRGVSMKATAAYLRKDQWKLAVPGIRGAPPKERKKPIFFRLAGITAGAAGEADLGHALLKQVPAEKANDLATVLTAFDELTVKEATRRGSVSMDRWNKLTEWFAAISANYQGEASAPVAAATKRFAQLSTQFDVAVREGTPEQQAEIVRGGEQALTALVKSLRALKPGDCRFQQALSQVVRP